MILPKAPRPRSLKIGIFTDDFYPYSGGVARSIELQLTELRRAGHEVILFAPKPFFDAPDFVTSEALDVWRIPGTPSFLCSLKFDKKRAEDIAARYDFDVVHSQNERGAMFLAGRIARIKNIPHIHTFHSNYAGTHRTSPIASSFNTLTYMRIAPKIMRHIRSDRPVSRTRLPRNLTAVEDSHFAKADWRTAARLAQLVDAYTSPAAYVIDNINDATHDEEKLHSYVVPNGVNDVFRRAKRIRPDEETVRFLSCGRLDAEKRVDVIIRAFAELSRDDAELYIMGTGTREQDLKKLAKTIVKKGRVEFLGQFEDHERVANEFANSDVFVFASYRFDTQGMVLGEAASAGTAILYCDDRLHVGVTKDNALLVHPSMTSIARGMRALLQNPRKRERMRAASKQLAPTLTAKVMEEKFLRVYYDTLTRFDR